MGGYVLANRNIVMVSIHHACWTGPLVSNNLIHFYFLKLYRNLVTKSVFDSNIVLNRIVLN